MSLALAKLSTSIAPLGAIKLLVATPQDLKLRLNLPKQSFALLTAN